MILLWGKEVQNQNSLTLPVGRPLVLDWCFQDKIQNAPFDYVLTLLQHDGSTKAKLTKKE
jgi:hypothetical protein